MCVRVLAARCGELELSLYLSLFARVCGWVCVCLSASRSFKTPPTALQRSAEKNEANWRKLLSQKEERALINASSSSTPSFVLCRRALPSHVATRARGERRRETHLPHSPSSRRGHAWPNKNPELEELVTKERAFSLSLSLSLLKDAPVLVLDDQTNREGDHRRRRGWTVLSIGVFEILDRVREEIGHRRGR